MTPFYTFSRQQQTQKEHTRSSSAQTIPILAWQTRRIATEIRRARWVWNLETTWWCGCLNWISEHLLFSNEREWTFITHHCLSPRCSVQKTTAFHHAWRSLHLTSDWPVETNHQRTHQRILPNCSHPRVDEILQCRCATSRYTCLRPLSHGDSRFRDSVKRAHVPCYPSQNLVMHRARLRSSHTKSLCCLQVLH